jgi:predicted dehydrogenase/quercetin dioxygenase-like cupin family protein
VVYVATPTGLHAAHGKQVLSAGKHLWCEKPLTCFLHETLDLLEMAKNRRVSLCEAFMYLYHPQFERLSRYLSEGRLGAIRSIACRFGIPNLERASFRTDASLGGGALFDVGCYPVSAIHALFPKDDVEVVHASVGKQNGYATDTDGHAVIALSGGAEAYLEWRSGCSYRNEIDLWGDNGSVSTQKIFSKRADYVPEFHIRDLRGAQTTESGASGNHFSFMLRSFRDTIEDPGAAEGERSRIARRAGTLHMIRTKAYVPVAASTDVPVFSARSAAMQNWKNVVLDEQSMWPKETRVELEAPHVDQRGSIQPLVNFPMKNLSLISSKKGTVRSNHYHATDWHYMYVLSGSFDYYYRPTGSGEKPKVITVKAGEMVFTPPMEDHATVFLEDTQLLAMSRNPRDQETYESDVRRVVLIDPASVAG